MVYRPVALNAVGRRVSSGLEREPAVSADPSDADVLAAAHRIVVAQLAQLRSLADAAQQRREQMTAELRQVERTLDEVVTQCRFAVERKLPSAAELTEREQTLRARHETLVHERQQVQHALKQLDQLVRQIDMSSATLSGTGEDESADPWMQALRAQIIKGREEERVRLAREVHDGPAQVLANTLMGLEQCWTLVQKQEIDRLGVMVDRLRGATRDGLHEVRRFIADLRPGRLDEQGLVAAIEEYTRRYRDAYNARVTFEADPLPRLPTESEIVLYRIVQEALQNAHKHARGAAIQVTLTVRRGRLVLIIRDDGPGFDPHEVVRRAGRESWGLTSMRERAELIGARFVVASRPGHGTEVTVALPLAATDLAP
jgi:two-component system sensor histidine kinase DegS